MISNWLSSMIQGSILCKSRFNKAKYLVIIAKISKATSRWETILSRLFILNREIHRKSSWRRTGRIRALRRRRSSLVQSCSTIFRDQHCSSLVKFTSCLRPLMPITQWPRAFSQRLWIMNYLRLWGDFIRATLSTLSSRSSLAFGQTIWRKPS